MDIVRKNRDEDADVTATADIVCISEDEILYLNEVSKGKSAEEIAKELNVEEKELAQFNQNLIKNLPDKSNKLASILSKAAFEGFTNKLDGKSSTYAHEADEADESNNRLSYLMKRAEEG